MSYGTITDINVVWEEHVGSGYRIWEKSLGKITGHWWGGYSEVYIQSLV